MRKLERTKARLRLVLVVAVALGCSSATLGGDDRLLDHQGGQDAAAI